MNKKIIIYVIGIFTAALLQGTVASASSFNAGRIIDDGVFTNRSSMTSVEIQTFLNSKVPNCDTYGTKPSEYGGGTRSQWASSRYGQSTFTCLKDYSENGRSAARIIYDVAQEFSINPQVLIVLLQKEQGLVTDEWPLNQQYRTATGYGCPDTAPCDSQYYGLTNQLTWAAKMFRAIMNNSPTWYTPYVLGNNFIRYSPDSSCGGSTVNIQNRSTQALYNYTPYQPNQAAINAGWGTAPCGAYGNRNFFLYFTSWFGSTEISYQSIKDTVNFERLVGASPAVQADSSSVGSFSSTISANSVLHNFFYDDTHGMLKHTWSDANGWHTEIVDGDAVRPNGSVKANVGAYVTGYFDGSTNTIKVFYYNDTTQSLRQGTLDIAQSTWSFITLDGQGGQSGYSGDVGQGIAAVKYAGHTQIMYYDATKGNLRHAWTNNQGWNFENLDGDRGSISTKDAMLGRHPSLAIYDNELQLFYYDNTNGNLRHAWTNSRGWNFENLDGDPGSISGKDAELGATPSIVVYNGEIQLFYYDITGGNLRHAWTNSRGWNFETLDGEGRGPFNYSSNVGERAVAKVYQSDLFVFYYDLEKSMWRIAYADNNGWRAADYDGSSRGISRSAAPTRGRLSVDVYDGSLQTFYQDSSNSLRHAWMNR